MQLQQAQQRWRAGRQPWQRRGQPRVLDPETARERGRDSVQGQCSASIDVRQVVHASETHRERSIPAPRDEHSALHLQTDPVFARGFECVRAAGSAWKLNAERVRAVSERFAGDTNVLKLPMLLRALLRQCELCAEEMGARSVRIARPVAWRHSAQCRPNSRPRSSFRCPRMKNHSSR